MPDPPWNVFPYHRPGSALFFPRDEGWHRLLPFGVANPDPRHMEWVYVNAHVREQGGAGRTFVLFAAYFTQQLRFLVVRFFDAQDRYIGGCTGTTLGRLSGAADKLDLRFAHSGGVDTWRSLANPFSSRLEAVDDAGAFAVRVSLTSTKRPYEAGGTGYMPFGRRGSFQYYSLTRLTVSGELELPLAGGSETVQVSGIGWFDHQWGPFFVTPFYLEDSEQYEWMSVQLDSGDELLLTTVWEPTGETPSLAAYGGAGLIRANETFSGLVGAHRWRRTKFWRSGKQNRVYAAGWTFHAPEWGAALTIEPRHADQLTPMLDSSSPGLLSAFSRVLEGTTNYFGDFWEGTCRVIGTFNGQPARGVAFAELVKRYEDPRLHLSVDRHEHDLTVLRWRVANPDEQLPLRHRFTLMRTYGSVLDDRTNLDVPVAVLDDPALPRGVELIAKAHACSLDGSLEGTDTVRIKLK